MSSLDDKPRLARALPLDRDSTATQASQEGTSSLGPDKSTSKPSYQEVPFTRPDDDIGLPLESVPSIVNKNSKTPRPRPRRRNGGFSLSQSLAADTLRKEMPIISDRMHDGRTRMSGAASHYPTDLSDERSTRYRGGSHPTQRTRSKSPLFPTGHDRRGHSEVSSNAADTRDELDPSEVTPTVLVDLVTGEVSKKNQRKIAGNLFRSLVGGNG
jgi:hypothetical protein